MPDNPLQRLIAGDFFGGFRDDIEVRNRQMRGEPLGNRQPQRAPAPYRDVSHLPPSSNIEDRRDETLNSAIARLTGMTPSQWAQAAKHPFTPMPDFKPYQWPVLPSTTEDPLSSAAGYNDIDALIRLLGKRK